MKKQKIFLIVITLVGVLFLSACTSKGEQESVGENDRTTEQVTIQGSISDMDRIYGSVIARGVEDIRNLPNEYGTDRTKVENCFISEIQSKTYSYFSGFMDKYQGKEEAFVRIVNYTDEGDPIIHDIAFLLDSTNDRTNGNKAGRIYVIEDTTRDHYGSKLIRVSDYDSLTVMKKDGMTLLVAFNGSEYKADEYSGDSFTLPIQGE